MSPPTFEQPGQWFRCTVPLEWMIRERLVCFTRKFIRNIVWVFGQYSSTLSIWPLLLFTTFIRLICQPAATASVTPLKQLVTRFGGLDATGGKLCHQRRGIVFAPVCPHCQESVQWPPDERGRQGWAFLGLSLVQLGPSSTSHPSSHPLSLLIEFEIDFMPRGQMGARVVWIVFTFCENAHFTLLELDLTPTWPKLWSCHRAHPSPQIGNLRVAISPGSNIQYFSPSCFNIAIITIPSLSLARCRLFWFLWGSSRHLLSTWKHVFTKSFIDSGYPKHPMQSWSDLLFKAGPKYELKIWLHAWLTASMDSEFPKVGFRIESRFTDNGENSAQYCSEREKMNLGCQLNSLCSYSTCLLEY